MPTGRRRAGITFFEGFLVGGVVGFLLVAWVVTQSFISKKWYEGFIDGLDEINAEKLINDETIPTEILYKEKEESDSKRYRAGYIKGIKKRAELQQLLNNHRLDAGGETG